MKKASLIFIFLTSLQLLGYSQTKNFIDQPYLDVNGYGDSLITPNEIFIKVFLSEKDTRDRVSIEELEGKMVTGLKTLGINTEKDLTTNDMGSNYKFYFLKKKDIMKIKEYILKVSDAVTASKVFILLEDLEISNSSIDHVSHSDIEKIKNITRVKAIENAKAKAQTLANPLGQIVGNAIYITDNENGTSLENGLQGRVPGLVIRGTNSLSSYKNEPPKIDFEKIKVSTTVSVKFVLK